MADLRLPAITVELDETDIADGDLFYGVDVSDPTDDATGTSFKVQAGSLRKTFTRVTEVEIDFGTTPVTSKVFAITDARAVTTHKIVAAQSYAAPTGKTAADNEWDALVLAAYVAVDGTISLVAHAITGPVVGKFKINYLLA